MRKADCWRSDLVADLVALKEVYGPLPMAPSRLLDIELVLTLFADYFPDESPPLAWTVLNGHPFPALAALSEQGRQAIAITRQCLPALLGRWDWEESLQRYWREVPAPYRLYRLDGNKLVEEPTSVLPERRKAMREALHTPPPLEEQPPRYAKAGRYRFYTRHDPQEVELPGWASKISTLSPPGLNQPVAQKRLPITIRLADLQEEAAWMDRHAPKGSAADQSWRQRIEAIRLCLVHATGLAESDTLTLDGLLHLIGMVGSGKSSLFTVLSVYLARLGYRVVLVQSDVATMLREQAVFETLRPADPEALYAVPLIGHSTRMNHLNRLHITEALRAGLSLGRDHPAYSMLSTVCPLDGLRHDVQPILPGEEPCTKLYTTNLDEPGAEETPRNRWDCPLMPRCPVHLPTRSLALARLWLATPASLLASGPQRPLEPRNLRYAELVMRYADVVLVDEADLVQIQFDDQFAPVEVLVGRSESWLDRLATQVSRQVYRPGRPLIGRRHALDRWLTAHQNAQRAVDRLYRWLRESATTRKWLGQTYFSGERLLQRVASELEQAQIPTEEFSQVAQAFMRTPLGSSLEPEGSHSAWQNIVHLELSALDETVAQRQMHSWLKTTLPLPKTIVPQQIEALAHHLLLALIVVVLDRTLHEVILEWRSASELLDIDQGNGGLFHRPSDDLVRLVPEAPMGAVLGFQYFDSANSGDGELRFFHVRGMGRALLYHLHDALQSSDGMVGPHVVLASGTSWAPGSWKYDLHQQPEAVLLPAFADATDATECFFEPQTDPEDGSRMLSISGSTEREGRIRNLRAMVQQLSRTGPFSSSQLDRELDQLPAERRRILLVVGSYDEALAVGEELATQRKDQKGEEVLTLIPDREGDFAWNAGLGKLPRSLLRQLPERSAQFLVAPLQAIERGHNILVGQQAAIGSVYFLVRPFPVPGDLHTAVQKMNAWASTYAANLKHLPATVAGKQMREKAHYLWDQMLQESETYLGSPDRKALLWTQFVLVWQCIGRLLRGGVPARIHFIDSKWAEKSARGEADTEATSMLIGFQQILQEALANPDPAQRAIAKTLYGSAAAALARTERVYHA